jgi:hypothetical protein
MTHLRRSTILRAIARRRRTAVDHLEVAGDATTTQRARETRRRAEAEARPGAAEGSRRRPGAW